MRRFRRKPVQHGFKNRDAMDMHILKFNITNDGKIKNVVYYSKPGTGKDRYNKKWVPYGFELWINGNRI